MQVRFHLEGPDRSRLARLKERASRESLLVDSGKSVRAMDTEEVRPFQVWAGRSEPPPGYHAWYRPAKGLHSNEEYLHALSERTEKGLHVVAVHHVTGALELPTFHLVLTGDGVMRSLSNEEEVDRFVMEYASQWAGE